MSSKIISVSLAIMAVLWSEAVSAQPSTAPPDAAEEAESAAEAVYDLRFVAFEDEYSTHVEIVDHGYTATGTVRHVRHPVALRGIQRERLEGLDFYEAVGRPDLAGAYRSRERKRTVVGGVALGSLVAMGTFAVLALRALPGVEFDDCDLLSDDYQACRDAYQVAEDRRVADGNARARTYGIAAGVSFVGWGLFAAIYMNMNPHPVGESERRLMAHDHNLRLRKELNLKPRRGLSVQPYVSDDGGGMMASGHF